MTIEQHPANARPGHSAPKIEGGSLPEFPAEVDAILARAGNLFRIARRPRGDAEWPHLRPHLIVAEATLNRLLREHPDHDEAVLKLQQIRRFLGRHP